MRAQHDYTMDKILFRSESLQEKPTEGYYTATSALTLGKNELHGTFPPISPGPSCQIYEITMLSLCGSIFVLAMVAIALKTVQKRVLHFQSPGEPRSPAQDLAAPEVVVANLEDGDQILTAHIVGPACIQYISETSTPPLADALAPEGKPDSSLVLSFSFASSIMPPDTAPKQ